MSSKVFAFTNNLLQRYEACMVLHAVGDALGFKNNQWESNQSTEDIIQQFNSLGGIEAIKCDPVNWPISDDTVLHLANAECLCDHSNEFDKNPKKFYLNLIKYYKNAIVTEDHMKRYFGYTTVQSIEKNLNEDSEDGYRIPFNLKGYGCGASMRSSCIGLRYPNENQLQELIQMSIETSRMTHNHPLGYLGGLVAALFTSYALQDRPIYSWGANMLNVLPLAMEYIKNDGFCVNESLDHWHKFEDSWRDYLKLRNVQTGQTDAIFPDKYDIQDRDEFYAKYALNRRWGSAGHDSVIIAYDAILGCNKDWKELCYRAVLHGGDNDSTGCIAASWFGALYGFQTVPYSNYECIEYKDRLIKSAQKIYELASKN